MSVKRSPVNVVAMKTPSRRGFVGPRPRTGREGGSPATGSGSGASDGTTPSGRVSGMVK